MHFYTMTIQEETESDHKSELKLWPNTDGKIYLEVGLADSEDAPYYTGFITLTTDDAKALIQELHRILKDMDDYDDAHQPKVESSASTPLLKVKSDTRVSDLGNPTKAEGKQLTLTQPLPNPESGQLPSKVKLGEMSYE